MSGFNDKYGAHAADFGDYKRPAKVVSTGVLALDYRLGTGGWTLGDCHVVYGDPDIGKSSALGLASIREAQKLGYYCAIVAMEPQFSPEWAEKHGVDTSRLIILRPKNGEEAFNMLIELVESEVIDWVVFDSIGAVIAQGEMESDGKAKAYGQSGLITRGVKAVAPIAYRNECGVLYINQVRDNTKAKIPGLKDMPGGHALKHACITRIQLKGTSNNFYDKEAGDKILVGREIAAVIERNKQSEGSNRRAMFNYWQKSVDGQPFGIDSFTDIVNTGVMTGVISKGGSYFTLPDNLTEKPIQGLPKLTAYLSNHPEAVEVVRKRVLEKL